MPKVLQVLPWAGPLLVGASGLGISIRYAIVERQRRRAERPTMEIVIEDQNLADAINSAATKILKQELDYAINPTAPCVIPDHSNAFVCFQFRNIGNTDGIFKCVKANISHSTDLPERLSYKNEWQTFIHKVVTAKQINVDQRFQVDFPIDGNIAESITQGKTYLWFYGLVTYQDVIFKREYCNSFFFRYSHRDRLLMAFPAAGEPIEPTKCHAGQNRAAD
jgi:hypothetical protein